MAAHEATTDGPAFQLVGGLCPAEVDRLKTDVLLPVVAYSVKRRIHDGDADYWDHATLLELAVLAEDHGAAIAALADSSAALREPWEAETILNNIREIAHARNAAASDQPGCTTSSRENSIVSPAPEPIRPGHARGIPDEGPLSGPGSCSVLPAA